MSASTAVLLSLQGTLLVFSKFGLSFFTECDNIWDFICLLEEKQLQPTSISYHLGLIGLRAFQGGFKMISEIDITFNFYSDTPSGKTQIPLVQHCVPIARFYGVRN